MVAAAIVAGILGAVLAGTAPGAEPPPNPKALWEAYPLDPDVPKAPKATTPAPKTQPPATPPPAPTPPAAPRASADEAGSARWPFALGGSAALVLVLALGALVVRARRRRPSAPPRPARTPALIGGATPEQLIAHAQALAKEAVAWDTYRHRQREGIGDMTEIADHEAPTPAPAPGAAASSSYADIGERVAGVLSAAEAAATQIREDARAEADEFLAAARRDAEDVRREAAAYDAETREAVDLYASERRREAEQEVQKQLADSESQARATRQAAEAMARQIEEAGRQRGQALRDESKAVEERLKKALAGFRRVTSELEELVGAPAAGETLTEALKPQQRAEDPAPPLSVVRSDEP